MCDGRTQLYGVVTAASGRPPVQGRVAAVDELVTGQVPATHQVLVTGRRPRTGAAGTVFDRRLGPSPKSRAVRHEHFAHDGGVLSGAIAELRDDSGAVGRRDDGFVAAANFQNGSAVGPRVPSRVRVRPPEPVGGPGDRRQRPRFPFGNRDHGSVGQARGQLGSPARSRTGCHTVDGRPKFAAFHLDPVPLFDARRRLTAVALAQPVQFQQDFGLAGRRGVAHRAVVQVDVTEIAVPERTIWIETR